MSENENDALEGAVDAEDIESKGSGRKWERLIAARKAKKLTQQQMADAIGVSLVTYNRWENRIIPPEAAWPFLNMARTLGVSLDYLFALDQSALSPEDKEIMRKATAILVRQYGEDDGEAEE